MLYKYLTLAIGDATFRKRHLVVKTVKVGVSIVAK